MTGEDLALDWLVGRLEADRELMRMVNGGVAPNAIWGTLRSPFVRVDYLDGEDTLVVGLHRVWVDATYHIRAVEQWRGSGRPDRTTVNRIGGRIDQLLHAYEEQTDVLAVHSFREEPSPQPALVENNSLWLQSGGIFRVRAQTL
jgi:hypothetical protein